MMQPSVNASACKSLKYGPPYIDSSKLASESSKLIDYGHVLSGSNFEMLTIFGRNLKVLKPFKHHA